jgi:valyl-tRNA synthetase
MRGFIFIGEIMDEFSLPKSYDFKNTEGRIYELWEKNGNFQPTNDPGSKDFDPSRKPFVISIPPPNVTGELHLGHAMFIAMEDLMIRYHRMKGIPTLWVPGSDHAGIATQLQVEKDLEKEGLKREDLGREKFEKRAWEWKEKYGGKITNQIRRLGASCDWTRERFTLDKGLSRAVREAFVRMYEKGLIYRGIRMVNWSPLLKTAVSDLEVEYSEEPGKLFYFKYQLADDPKVFIPVATTRPETIPGDTAVCVHPLDERYKKFIGKKVVVPILNRQIPVIADEYIDREFGTGALKVTPSHSANDYALAERHHLEMINILNKDVTINENGGPYQGMDRFECRKKIWEDMGSQGLVIKEEPYTLNVPRSQRGGEIIEPLISTQWFVKIQPLADAAIRAVRNGDVSIVPEHFTKVFFNWMENIQDWCISRQLWWGHRIPVWYCDECGKMTITRSDPEICEHCQSKKIHQDEDVLDTWFSSGLWPFSTLGWPEETPDYKYFYPTSVLETGYDILFFWVARMIMDGLEFTGKAPFHTVYLHGLIRDENGQKMSKTKGNVIDPLIVMDEMGTDALRFTLLVGSTPGNDMNLSVKKVQANRNFANKIWNAGRFVISALERAPESASPQLSHSLADRWITARSNQLVRDVERLFTTHQYGEAGRQIYDFFWSEFADWYIEIAKVQISENDSRAFYTTRKLVTILDRCLRLLHPFTPFVTEELWSYLKKACIKFGIKPESGMDWETGLINALWPKPSLREEWETASIDQFNNLIVEPVKALRNLRIENDLLPTQKPSAIIIYKKDTNELIKLTPIICALAHLNQLSIQETQMSSAELQQFPSTTLDTSGMVVILKMDIVVNVEEKLNNLKNELNSIESQIMRINNLLKSEFALKAPKDVIEKERQKLAIFIETAEKIKHQLM